MEKQCVMCNATFESKTNKEIVCSDGCRQDRRNQMHREWHRASQKDRVKIPTIKPIRLDYVNNKELSDEIIRCKESGVLSDAAIAMFYKMIDGVHRRLQYRDRADEQDCKAGSMLDIFKYWRGYNPEKSTNAFSYYTQIIKMGSAKMWKKLHDPNLKTVTFTELWPEGHGDLI